MQYISTRGQMEPKSFSQILLEGLAPDGGLTVPETYPKFSKRKLTELSTLNYNDLAFEILSPYMDDIPAKDLKKIIDKSYSPKIFCNGRKPEDAKEITPITPIDDTLFIQELSNGPTLAFKDLAMQFLGNVFEYVLEKEDKYINILGATSGDTGSAAEYAMKGKKRLNLFMLSPSGKMSDFQRAQMYSLQDENIHNIAVKTMFDGCQDLVKLVNKDAEFKEKHRISAVNSINWARIAAQIVYYFKGYFAVAESVGERVDFCVPSGNFGNVCAGHIARLMGLPIGRLIVATNENDVLDEFFKTGGYAPRNFAYQTSSPSMDISKASNLERFVFDLFDRDPKMLREQWDKVENGKGFKLPLDVRVKMHEKYGFTSEKSTHTDRITTMHDFDMFHSLFIDTHTADGIFVAESVRDIDVKTIVMETANAVKFEADVKEATKKTPPRPRHLENIEGISPRVVGIEPNLKTLMAYIEENAL